MIQTEAEIVNFLADRTVFRVLNERVLSGITQLFDRMPCGPGHVVYRKGDEADAVYVILEGSVQELAEGPTPKVLRYYTAGDCFGEEEIANDCARNSTIRVPEEAVILKLSRKAFDELQTYFPELAAEVNQLIEKRASGNVQLSAPGLQGNLAFFDLPTVIQTVVGSRQSGILKLSGRAGKPAASVVSRLGKIVHATFLHLHGEHAIFELLTRHEPFDFVFEPHRDSDVSSTIDKALSAAEPYKLLLEGARRADELPALMREFEWPGGVPMRATKSPDFTRLKGEAALVGQKLWLLMEVGLNVKTLCDKLSYDRYTVLFTLTRMRECQFIKSKYAKVEPAEAPNTVAPAFAALNTAAANLALILGKEEVHAALVAALSQSSRKYPLLASLKVHPESAALDLRDALPEVSQSKTTKTSLEELTTTFLRLASQIKTKS